jgi:hypothetical protein
MASASLSNKMCSFTISKELFTVLGADSSIQVFLVYHILHVQTTYPHIIYPYIVKPIAHDA